MRSHPLHFSSARWPLVLLALVLAATTGFAQNVGGFIHGKAQNFLQTSSTAPVVDTAQPFQFGSLVSMGTATINGASLTFSGSASPRTYTAVVGSGDFSILDTFTTQALLDAAYQSNSNYTVSINTSAGLFSRAVFLFAFSYPTTPRLTVPAGDWLNGALAIDPTQPYTFTWGAFSNAQAADLIQLVIRNSGLTLNPFPATQTSYTLPAGTVPSGFYTCDLVFVRVAGATAADANIGAGYATLVKNTGFTLRAAAPLALAAAVSRKIHGAAGTFDIDLPLSVSTGVECRTGGATGDHTIVFTFSNAIASGNASVTLGTATIAGSPIISGNTVTVNLTGVANAQTVTVTLSNVTDIFSQVLPNTAVSASFLLGDTTGNGTVNATDIGQTKAQSGLPVSASNFREDLNVSGAINATDIGLVKSFAGQFVP